MARPLLYVAGSVVNGYLIVGRPASRKALVKCAEDGCDAFFEVNISNVLTQTAKRYCPVHRKEHLYRRTSAKRAERARQMQLQAISDAQTMIAAARNGEIRPQPIREWDGAYEAIAQRKARSLVGLHSISYRNEGTCHGWFMVGHPTTTSGGARKWNYVCALCGAHGQCYQQQFERTPIPRCPKCCSTAKRYKEAAAAYENYVGAGHDMTDPENLMRAAWSVASVEGFRDKITAIEYAISAYLQCLKHELHNAEVALAAQHPTMPEIIKPDYASMELEEWPLDELQKEFDRIMRDGVTDVPYMMKVNRLLKERRNDATGG